MNSAFFQRLAISLILLLFGYLMDQFWRLQARRPVAKRLVPILVIQIMGLALYALSGAAMAAAMFFLVR